MNILIAVIIMGVIALATQGQFEPEDRQSYVIGMLIIAIGIGLVYDFDDKTKK